MNDEIENGPISGPYFQQFEFDENQIDRILHLLELKAKCVRRHDDLLLEFGIVGVECLTFYSAMIQAIDSLLLAQINDEVAASMPLRGPTTALVEALAGVAQNKGVFDLVVTAVADLDDLFVARRELMIGSSFLDLVVGAYSAFEFFMSRIHDRLPEKEKSSRKKEEKIKGLIGEYVVTKPEEQESVLQKIIKEGGSFVSGANKIDQVMNLLKSFDGRDIENDKVTVEFFRNARNTVHNLGVSGHKKDFNLTVADGEISLLSGRPMTLKDRSQITRLCGELAEVYFVAVLQNYEMDLDAFILTDYGQVKK